MNNENIVIWHIGRCGSTVLSSVLNQHNKLQCLGEVFNPLMDIKELNKDIPNIDLFFSNLVNHNPNLNRIVEVKFLKSQHLTIYNQNLSDLIQRFKEIGYFKFVVLERKNYLKRMISHCVAQETKVYHLKKGKSPKLHKIYMDVNSIKVGTESKSLIEWFEIFKSSYVELRNQLVDLDYLDLQYENDIFFDVNKAYNKICRFLNIESIPINIPYVRTNPFKINEVIINYNEVKEIIIKNGYFWMLD